MDVAIDQANQQAEDSASDRHDRIKKDIKKVQEHPDYPNMPGMLRAYVDCLVLDIELLMNIDGISRNHIRELDAHIDRLLTQK